MLSMKDYGAPLDGPVAKLLDQNSPRCILAQPLNTIDTVGLTATVGVGRTLSAVYDCKVATRSATARAPDPSRDGPDLESIGAVG